MSPRAAIFMGKCLECEQHGCALQPVTAIHHIAGIDRLAAVCDGNLLLLDPESLEEWHVPGAKVAAGLPSCHAEHLQGPGKAAPLNRGGLCAVCITPTFTRTSAIICKV